MNRLIEFLFRYKHWFLFFSLEVLALLLLFNSRIHHSAIRTSAINSFVGYSNDIANKWYGYIELKKENEELLTEKAKIENKYLQLLQDFENYKANNTLILDSINRESNCEVLLTAQIISTSKVSGNPFFIINRGSQDGVKRNMGVVGKSGVVGSIMSTSEHYSIIIPITNPNFQLNCLSKQTGSSGTLVSYGVEQFCSLKNIPQHINLVVGDSILTGKDSYIFPEGLLVGRISNNHKQTQHNVSLATDFNRLHNVYIINKKKDVELSKLEEEISTDD